MVYADGSPRVATARWKMQTQAREGRRHRMKFVLEIEFGSKGMKTYADMALAIRDSCATDGALLNSSAPVVGDRYPVRDAGGSLVGHWRVEA